MWRGATSGRIAIVTRPPVDRSSTSVFSGVRVGAGGGGATWAATLPPSTSAAVMPSKIRIFIPNLPLSLATAAPLSLG